VEPPRAPSPAAAPAPASAPVATQTATQTGAPVHGSAVQQLAAGVAHSIRNPLQILELQLGSVESDGKVDVPGMREQVRRIATVVDGLTRFSGHRNLPLRPVDIDQLVRGVFGPRPGIGAPANVKASGEKIEVMAAIELLRAGLESLRSRAERLTPPNRSVEVRTQVRNDASRRFVEISVTDGGPPLPEDRRARLFEPYPEPDTVQDGTGLDLAALAGIVRDHGGSVSALAGQAGGTTIVVRLPVRAAGDVSQPITPAPGRVS
jgi:signal transduction histidine kinase